MVEQMLFGQESDFLENDWRCPTFWDCYPTLQLLHGIAGDLFFFWADVNAFNILLYTVDFQYSLKYNKMNPLLLVACAP